MRLRMPTYSWAVVVLLFLGCGLGTMVQAQTAAAAAPASAAPAKPVGGAPSPAMDTPLNVKAAQPPSAEELAKGDPGGTKTGTVSDIVVSDANKGLTLADTVNQVGQNRIAINFVWTLIAGFLVMFMQAGFALVETGLCRAKNANHTMMMNFMVYGFGLFAFWVCGFALQMGGGAPYSTLGGAYPLNSEHTLNFLGKTWGVWGTHGFFLTQAGSYDVAVMVLFLFQMVFMDTALTIVTGAAAERWKYVAFAVSSIFMGALTYPLFANWAWGGGWLSQLGANFGLGHGYCDFAGSGVVHAVGGLSALAVSHDHRAPHWKISSRRQAQRYARPRHSYCARRLFHPGLRLVRVQSRKHSGRLGERRPPDRLHRREHHARRMHGLLRRRSLHVDALRQTGRFDVRQWLAGGSGGHHCPQRVR